MAFLSRTKGCLARFSLGKYNHGLYHRRRLYFSTWSGGLLTLLLILAFLTYLMISLAEIFSTQKTSTLVTQVVDLLETPDIRETGSLGAFSQYFISSFRVRLDQKYNASCPLLTLGFYDNYLKDDTVTVNFSHRSNGSVTMCEVNLEDN